MKNIEFTKNNNEVLEKTPEKSEIFLDKNFEEELNSAENEKNNTVIITKENIEKKANNYIKSMEGDLSDISKVEEIKNTANLEIEEESSVFNDKINEIKNESSVEKNKTIGKETFLNDISINFQELRGLEKELSKDKNNKELQDKIKEKNEEIKNKKETIYTKIILEEVRLFKEQNPDTKNSEVSEKIIKPLFKEFDDAALNTLEQKKPNNFVLGLAKIDKILPKNKIAKKIILTTLTAGITTLMVGVSGATIPIAAGMFALKVARIAITSHFGEKIGEFISEKIIHSLNEKQNNIDSENDTYLENFNKIEKQKMVVEKASKYLGILSGLVLSGTAEIKLEEIVKGLEDLASNAVSHGAHGAVEVAGHAANSSHGVGSVAIHEIKQGIIDTATEKTVEKSEKYNKKLAA